MNLVPSDSAPRTVFVVGAGASKEVKLPIGSELKEAIASALDLRFHIGGQHVSGDLLLFEAIRALAQNDLPLQLDTQPYMAAARRICDGMPQAASIDNYLDVHSEDKYVMRCGKIAIVRTILEAERNSSLFMDPLARDDRLDFKGLSNTWFGPFFQLLTENCKRAELHDRLRKLTLVVFNYDRCIEQFLFWSFQNYYHIGELEAIDLLSAIEIFHPYGTVGLMPWSGETDSIAFGATTSAVHLIKLSRKIKTFTEVVEPEDARVDRIRERMCEAQRLVFLGFAFHPMNVELLLPPGAPITANAKRRVFGTGVGLSRAAVDDIRLDLGSRLGMDASGLYLARGVGCHKLFQDHRRGLSFVQEVSR
jgi:hypothetical protein